MKYKLPELSDEKQVLSYIKDHYSNNETSISASNGLTSVEYSAWIKMINDWFIKY